MNIQTFFSKLVDAIHRLISDAQAVAKWAQSYNYLKLNADKTIIMFIGTRARLGKIDSHQLRHFYPKDVHVPYTSSIKLLGIHLESSLDGSQQYHP